ncbi:MAG TPA: PD-(D/E)XK nuclease family protein, partial [Acidimicrobiales bacterium]|nr:PD-(D/E)XK nuclease family protein [Acidimicrobiales bacterium]
VHAAKGLEFPIVIVAGLNTVPRRWRPAEVLWRSDKAGPPIVSVGRRDRPWHTQDYEAERDSEIAMEQHEAIRLLYVACTRARDHLIVSLHHKPEPANSRSAGGCLAARLLPHAERAEKWSRRLSDDAVRLPPDEVASAPSYPAEGVTPLDPERWLADRDALVARLGAERAIAATALATAAAEAVAARDAVVAAGPSAAPGAPGQLAFEMGEPPPSAADVVIPEPSLEESETPWHRGRAGSAFGRAVHAVLQSVDLVSGDGIDGIALAQAAAEGIAGHEREVAASARAALQSPVVTDALAGRHWREVYVAADLDGVIIDGFIDLLVEADDGLVVVDYKTDELSDAELPAAAKRYRVQLATYAVAIEQNLGRPVTRAELIFTRASGARQVSVADLDAAKAEVLALAAQLRDSTSDSTADGPARGPADLSRSPTG